MRCTDNFEAYLPVLISTIQCNSHITADFFLQNKTHILYLAQRGPEVLNGIPAPVVLKARWKKGLSKRTGAGDSRVGTHVNNGGAQSLLMLLRYMPQIDTSIEYCLSD